MEEKNVWFLIRSLWPHESFFLFIYIYIMQSTLPTTIYVQNLSFLVTEIWISHNFFSIGPIYMIFMGDREQVWNFWTPTQKRVKRVKKGQNLKFCKKVEIFHFFFQKVTLFFPFLYFFQRNGQYKHFLIFLS